MSSNLACYLTTENTEEWLEPTTVGAHCVRPNSSDNPQKGERNSPLQPSFATTFIGNNDNLSIPRPPDLSTNNSIPLTTQDCAQGYDRLLGLSKSVPIDRAKLPKFLNQYLDICCRFTDAEEGALITALLPVIAVNIGNRVSIKMRSHRTKCHLWCVIAGRSTISRKSTAIELAEHTLAPFIRELDKMISLVRAQNNPILGTTTLAKTLNLLSKNANRLFIFNEFASLMLGNKQTYNAAMQSTLTDLYDGKSRDFATLERTDRVVEPAISIIAGSTEGHVYSFFQNPVERDSGFPQRFLYSIIVCDDKKFETSWLDIEQDFTDLEAFDAIYSVFRSISAPQDLKLSAAAKKLWARTHDAVMNAINPADEGLISYASRIYNDSFPSICTIITLMEHHHALQLSLENQQEAAFFANTPVSEEAAAQALYLCNYYLANARPLVKMLESGGSLLKEGKIIQFLQKSPQFSAKRSEIMRNLSISAKSMNECIANLKEMDYICELYTVSANASKRTTVYKLVSTV